MWPFFSNKPIIWKTSHKYSNSTNFTLFIFKQGKWQFLKLYDHYINSNLKNFIKSAIDIIT